MCSKIDYLVFFLLLRELVFYLQVVFIFHVIVPTGININQMSSNVLISVWDQQLFPRSSDIQDSVSHQTGKVSYIQFHAMIYSCYMCPLEIMITKGLCRASEKL